MEKEGFQERSVFELQKSRHFFPSDCGTQYMMQPLTVNSEKESQKPGLILLYNPKTIKKIPKMYFSVLWTS